MFLHAPKSAGVDNDISGPHHVLCDFGVTTLSVTKFSKHFKRSLTYVKNLTKCGLTNECMDRKYLVFGKIVYTSTYISFSGFADHF